MKIRVCDALCGSGKTMACIDLMNRDTGRKYIFITPYLDEVDRIKRACSGRGFKSPERRYTSGHSKLGDIHRLLAAGENIASTHALFSYYTEETRELIRAGNYTLILDEVIDLFQTVDMDVGDVQMLIRNGVALREDETVVWGDREYSGVLFDNIVHMSRSRNLIDYNGSFFFWSIPIEVFRCFDEAYVLTYMFEHQVLRHYFDVHGIEYSLIGTRLTEEGYRFCPLEEMDRRVELRDKIHICDVNKYNEIGRGTYSLSAAWFNRSAEVGSDEIVCLKNNLRKYYRQTKSDSSDKMWTTLNRYRGDLKSKGYSSGFVVFNKRATCDFANKHHLAYCLNVFLQPWTKNYLMKSGVKNVNQDMYALSVLIQWIFRSALRNGEEIWIYIPSERMRYLLRQWLDNLAEGDDLREILFATRKNYKRRRKAARHHTLIKKEEKQERRG